MAKRWEHHCAICSTSTLQRGIKSLEKCPHLLFMSELGKAKPVLMQAVKTLMIFAPTVPDSAQFHLCSFLPSQCILVWSGIGCVGHVHGLGPLLWGACSSGPNKPWDLRHSSHILLSQLFANFIALIWTPKRCPEQLPAVLHCPPRKDLGEGNVSSSFAYMLPLHSLFLKYFLFFLNTRILEPRKK